MADAFPPKLKLHHQTPAWVPVGAMFHIRIRCALSQPADPMLTTPVLGNALLNSARLYHTRQRWWCRIFLLMPDHIHALLAFPPAAAMSRVIGEWKHFHARHTSIQWQDGYFDHRIRHGTEWDETLAYIRNNPVVKNLCRREKDWPWFWEPGAALAKPPRDGAPGPPSPPPRR